MKFSAKVEKNRGFAAASQLCWENKVVPKVTLQASFTCIANDDINDTQQSQKVPNKQSTASYNTNHEAHKLEQAIGQLWELSAHSYLMIQVPKRDKMLRSPRWMGRICLFQDCTETGLEIPKYTYLPILIQISRILINCLFILIFLA